LGDGGLAVALAESSFGPAGVGAAIDLDSTLRPEFLLFHEGPSRVLISTHDPAAVEKIAAAHGVDAPRIGVTLEGELEIRRAGDPLVAGKVQVFKDAWSGALEKALQHA
jgi:phosphoribosylformylglycinamidine synthase